MTSRDVHDVLNIPSDHSGVGRPSKKQKSSAIRPNLKGLAREVQNLSGDNPIAIVPEVSFFKKRRLASRKPATKWELKPFTNSARGDDGALVLRHWRRKTEDGPPADVDSQPGENEAEGSSVTKVEKPEDSAFAKFNVHVQIPQYTDDQYHSNLQSSTWTKEETDYLLELAKDYDLRWAIIWDRYDFQPKGASGDFTDGSNALVPAGEPRTMEDLKARYYEISAKMMAVQTPVQYMNRSEFELFEMVQKFDPEQEKRRKQFALNTMARNKDEAREEESLLLEVKRIVARTERFNEERRELYNRLDYPATETDINSFKSSAGLQNLLQTLMTSDKAKKQRKQAMGPGDVASPSSAVPTSAVSETHANRRESIAASAVSNHHRADSDARTPATPAEPTPTSATAPAANKKKGAPQPERRKLTQQEEQIYGVSYHDRLGSGPTFRYEKINKLYSHKSGQQQLRITNVLSELGIPPRLVMPTAQVTAQFELLWTAVTSLVDLRKVNDRLDGEIKIEEAKKAERDKVRGVVVSPATPATNGTGDKEEGGAETNGEGGKDQQKTDQDKVEASVEVAKPDGDGEGAGKAAEGDSIKVDSAGVNGENKRDQEEADGEKRPGSSGGSSHKRSASVLSSVSDKSAKRQKK